MLEFSIISISTFVTILNEVVKYLADTVFKKDVSRYIPMFSVLFGIVLGVVGFYMPDVEMGNNVVESIFIGIAAGSAATGVNQIGKQLNKKDENGNDINTIIDNIILKSANDVITQQINNSSQESIDIPCDMDSIENDNEEK